MPNIGPAFKITAAVRESEGWQQLWQWMLSDDDEPLPAPKPSDEPDNEAAA